MTILGWLALGLATLVILVTLLPFSGSDEGWIRIWDFPRPQIAVAAVIALVLLAIAGFAGRWSIPVIILALGVVAAFLVQMQYIFHYTPLASKEVGPVDRAKSDECVNLITVNVYQHNREAGALLDLVKRYEPDILLAVETDSWWRDELEPLAERYPHVASLPLDNTYGMTFMTRLEPIAPVAFRFLIEDDIPSIRTELKLPSGDRVAFYGLHPQPPTPLEDSTERDLELIAVAHELKKERLPAIVAGDLNDVAWSATTRRFKTLSGVLDPRVGRGLYSTFHAQIPGMNWPLDHLFHTPHFSLAKLEVMPGVGSDHYPMYAQLCLEHAGAQKRDPAPSARSEGCQPRASRSRCQVTQSPSAMRRVASTGRL